MNATFEERLQRELDELKKAGTYKHLRHLTTPMAPEVHMEEAGDVIVLSSNNYLGLSDNPEVIEAGKRGLDKYGAGTASVRFICGTFDIHRELEDAIAKFLSCEASLSYVACWNANTGLFATICGEGSGIISDELNHASIIDGVRLASKAKRAVYKHGDMADLERKLQEMQGLAPVLVVSEKLPVLPDTPGFLIPDRVREIGVPSEPAHPVATMSLPERFRARQEAVSVCGD